MASIVITPANVLLPAGATPTLAKVGGSGLTITAGMALYRTSSDVWEKADCDAGSEGDAIRGTNGVGIALSGGSTGQYITVATQVLGTGIAAGLTIGGTVTDGARIYLSPTAGELTMDITDLSAGDSVCVCGFVYTDGTVRWNPQMGGVLP